MVFVGNWGISIVLLTIVIKAFVLAHICKRFCQYGKNAFSRLLSSKRFRKDIKMTDKSSALR